MNTITKQAEREHKHIWKYTGNKRVCEAPFPTVESCGKVEECSCDSIFCPIHDVDLAESEVEK